MVGGTSPIGVNLSNESASEAGQGQALPLLCLRRSVHHRMLFANVIRRDVIWAWGLQKLPGSYL